MSTHRVLILYLCPHPESDRNLTLRTGLHCPLCYEGPACRQAGVNTVPPCEWYNKFSCCRMRTFASSCGSRVRTTKCFTACDATPFGAESSSFFCTPYSSLFFHSGSIPPTWRRWWSRCSQPISKYKGPGQKRQRSLVIFKISSSNFKINSHRRNDYPQTQR